MQLFRNSDLPFLLTPLREGRRNKRRDVCWLCDFYSRPCGRGDKMITQARQNISIFLLTPLLEGRPHRSCTRQPNIMHFYSRPCGRGDDAGEVLRTNPGTFLLTPLREGRRMQMESRVRLAFYFYSRPCGRGDIYVLAP